MFLSICTSPLALLFALALSLPPAPRPAAGMPPATPGEGTVELTYSPAQGSRWRKEFVVSTEMGFDDLQVSMDGREVDSQFLPKIEMDAVDTKRLEVVDELREVEDGTPRVLVRSYETAEREAEQTMEMVGMMPEPIESFGEGESPLEGKAVEFSWNEDGEVERRYADEAGADDLLAPLAVDLDFFAWLPEERVGEGDSWTVSAEDAAALFEPGGDLSIVLEGEGAEEFQRGEGAESEYDGELTLRLTGFRFEEGEELAFVEFDGDFESESTYEGSLEQVPVASGTATNFDTVGYEVEGELVWDLRAGVLRSLEAEAELVVESRTVKDPGQSGPEYESKALLSGTLSVAVQVEAED